MFAQRSRYEQAVRLAVKAWMMWCDTGSEAAKRAYVRMMKKARELRAPSGEWKGKLWVDRTSEREQEIVGEVYAHAAQS